MKTKTQKYYFTFGFGQSLENCYTIVLAKDAAEARQKMCQKYGSLWAFQYEEKEWIAESGQTLAEKWKWRKVAFGTPNEKLVEELYKKP